MVRIYASLRSLALGLVGLTLTSSCATDSAVRFPGRIVEERDGQLLMRQCSRAVPPGVQGFWRPSEDMIAKLEAELSKVRRLQATSCCFVGATIRDPQAYQREYLGVVIGGRMLIYVNAFLFQEGVSEDSPVVICDGGDSAWGVLYDPATGEFSELAVNGIS